MSRVPILAELADSDPFASELGTDARFAVDATRSIKRAARLFYGNR
jgi:hypothetical protein